MKALRRLLLAAVIGSTGVLLPASASAARSGAAGHLWHVAIGVDFFFHGFVVNKYVPDKLVIHVGDRVQWTNLTPVRPQTVTFGPVLNTPPLIPSATKGEANPLVVQPTGGTSVSNPSQVVYSSGALMSGIAGLPKSFTFSFPTPGSYLYRSLFHPAMTGEIDVVPAGQPVSSDPPDNGPSYYSVIRSAEQAVDQFRGPDRDGAGNDLYSTNVTIGGGDANVSVTLFAPESVTIKVGSSITWKIGETNGDPHALVFNPALDELGSMAPLYTKLAHDGGLVINPAYFKQTLATGSSVITDTIRATSRLTTGILYGSSVIYPSAVPSTYTLTFNVPANITYVDAFPPGEVGTIRVVPCPANSCG